MLAAIFGNSPFLGQVLLSEPDILAAFLAQDSAAVLADLIAELTREAASCRRKQPDDAAASPLSPPRGIADRARRYQRTHGRWNRLPALSADFADTALKLAVDHLLRRAAAAGDLALANPERPSEGSGLVVLGMGKLGARELNYSSDIDLIVLYDRSKVDYRGRRSVQDCFVRLARDLVRLLQDHTEDGYVFRTDLRLRPDPGSTPLAMSVLAAETYYEGMGQNWERAAMIKARAVGRRSRIGRRVPEASAAFHLAPQSRFCRHPGHSLHQAPDPCGQGPSRDRRRRPQHQARPRRHPRDRVLCPDPAADLGRARSGAAPAGNLRCDPRSGRGRPRETGDRRTR